MNTRSKSKKIDQAEQKKVEELSNKKGKKFVPPKHNDENSNNLTPTINNNIIEERIINGLAKDGVVVDHELKDSEKYHIVQDITNLFNGKYFHVTLNQSDITKNKNKFYIIQLLSLDNDINSYFVWLRWGRIGYSGQTNMIKFNNFDEAAAYFLTKYNYKVEGGYTPLEINFSNTTSESLSKTVQIESKLPSNVQNLLKLLFNINIMSEQMSEIGYDINKLPLGKLGSSTLKEGMDILNKIEDALKKNDQSQIKNLSSKFYSLIPHSVGFSNMSNFVINTNTVLNEKISLLDSLSEIKIITSIIEETKDQNNILDKSYSSLNSSIIPVDPKSEEFSLIDTYLTNTSQLNNQQTVKILECFSISRNDDNINFKDYGNNMFLWYGTRISNVVGILSNGLKLPASNLNFPFGNGIYFADVASKSLCSCFPSHKIGILLLCLVSLGNTNELIKVDNEGKLPEGKNSNIGLGQKAPSKTSYIDFQEGKIPLGIPERTDVKSYFGYNDYVVYDSNQVKIKYLLKLQWV